MAVPEFQNFMLPILKLFEDNKIHNTNECMNQAINYFNLNETDMSLTVPSGKQTLVANRVYWSLTYLKKSLLITTIKRGEYKITNRGLDLLKTDIKKIDKKLLSQYDEYIVFSKRNVEYDDINNTNVVKYEKTPEEEIGLIYEKINNQLADDILEIITEKDAFYFERLVMDVLTKMGYGDADSNIVTKKTGDGGIDGIINQDKLGLDKIYVQAKKWQKKVGNKDLQQFVGALNATKSNKGIFITTSDYTKYALNYIESVSSPIVLINGQYLARLMIKYNIGLQIRDSYDIKKIDIDYFEMI